MATAAEMLQLITDIGPHIETLGTNVQTMSTNIATMDTALDAIKTFIEGLQAGQLITQPQIDSAVASLTTAKDALNAAAAAATAAAAASASVVTEIEALDDPPNP